MVGGGSLDKIRPGSELPEDLQKLYSTRFTGQEAYRNRIWQVLASEFFSRWVETSSTILDLGCGYGEFINNVKAGKKYAMDLNPSTKDRLDGEVEFLEQDCSLPWPFPDNSLYVFVTSNFFEHLPTKHVLLATIAEAHRCLKPKGRLIALGPNVKYLTGTYWDFFRSQLLRASAYKTCAARDYRGGTSLPQTEGAPDCPRAQCQVPHWYLLGLFQISTSSSICLQNMCCSRLSRRHIAASNRRGA